MALLKRYKILHLIDKFSMDGINPSSCAYLIRAWHRYADHDQFDVITAGLKKPEPAAKIYEEERMKCFFLGNGKYSPKNVSGLMDLIDKEQIDLVHLHGYSSANFGRIAAKKRGIPNIVHEHAIMKVLPHQYFADFILKRKTDSAIAVSNAVKDFMVNGRHVSANLINIIWNGIDLDHFQKCESRKISAIRKELCLSENDIAIGTITRFREEKGNEFLVKAIPNVVKKYPNAKFFIVGDGPLKDFLDDLRIKLNIQNNLQFLGFRKDVVELISSFDIVVIPSISEGFGLALAEAMAIGKPTVATEVGGMVEIANGKKSVKFVPPADPEGMANGINYLIENPDFSKSLAENSYKERDKFGIKKNVYELEKLYLSLLNGRKN